MPDTRYFNIIMRDIGGYSSAFTDRVNEIRVKDVGMYILEMEDVLFHLNSAVMMPENPQGKSSKDGEKSDGPDDLGDDFKKEQLTVTGIKALALVFTQFELDPDKKMIIAGHTDTSGEPKYNFELSELRALNILYLLTVNKEKWAEVCEKKHKVEDYQQIMKYFSQKKNLDCDPGKIDNAWGDKTKKATENFLHKTITELPDVLFVDETIDKIKKDSQKKWPKEAWYPVFDLYIQELADFMEVKPSELKVISESRLKFIDDDKKYVACGESFPLDDRQKKNYRSQVNRRVEIVLFDKAEIPTIHCPPQINGNYPNKVHEEKDCPLWDKSCYLPLYIDTKDLYCIVYHLRFVYYDRIQEKLQNVPKNLTIKAYEEYVDGGRKTRELTTVNIYKNDIYNVKVQFASKLNDPKRVHLHFGFETDNKWIFTKDKSSKPEIVTITDVALKKLSLDEQRKYHDLPKVWSSNFYLVRYQNKSGGAVSDEDIINGNDKRVLTRWLLVNSKVYNNPDSYKPFGSNSTGKDKPLTFCLDDIILCNDTYVPIGLAKEQGAFFDENMNVIEPDKNSPNYKNYLTKGEIEAPYLAYNKIIKSSVAVIFKGKLFVTARERIKDGDFVGWRPAMHNYKKTCIIDENFCQIHPRGRIGHYYLYYLIKLGLDPKKEINFIFNHIRWKFEGVADPTRDPPEPAFNATPEWIETSVTNIMNFWNNRSNGSEDRVALINKDSNGVEKNKVNVRYYLEHVTTNQHTRIKVFPAGCSNRSNMGYDEAEINADQNKPDPGNNSRFTAAHETGHAVSLEDDYIETSNNASYYEPGFLCFVPGSPYYPDTTALMKSNIEMRSRYYWHLSQWLFAKENKPYSVKFKTYDYSLPYYNIPLGRSISTYITNPVDQKPDAVSGAVREQYDLFLYPLGDDKYSKGNDDNSIAKDYSVNGILIIKVKMKFEFLDDKKFDDYWRTLINVQREIQRNFNSRSAGKRGRWYAVGEFKGTPNYKFSKCVLYFSPRFLVKNFPKKEDYRAEGYAKSLEIYQKDSEKKFDYNAAKSKYNTLVGTLDSKKHFEVIVRSADFFEGSSAVWDSTNRKKLTISYGWTSSSEDFLIQEFPKMIGINKAPADISPADLKPLVQKILPDADVKSF